MQSLRDLNNYCSQTMEFTDLREPAVITDVPEPTDLTFTELTRSFTVKNTVNIVEIIQPQICNVRYKINISGSDSFVYWLTLPDGCYVTQSGSIWTIWGVTVENWDIIKNPTIELAEDYFGSFSYSAAIVYDLPSQANIEIEWNVGIYAPQTQMTAESSLSLVFTRKRDFNFYGQALFSQTANLRAAAFTPAARFNWSISATNNYVGPIIYYPTTTGTWTITARPDNAAKVVSMTTTYAGGGTKSYNNATKTLTITGTKEQVNSHLNSLQFVATNVKGDFNMLYTADNTVDDFVWETTQLANNLDVQYLNLPTVATQTYLINTPKTIQGASTINDDEYDGTGQYTWTLTANPTTSVKAVTANYYENLPFYYDDAGSVRTPKTVVMSGTAEGAVGPWNGSTAINFQLGGFLRVTDILPLGAGSWTVECWAELKTDPSKNQMLWDYRTNSTSNSSWHPVLYLATDGSLRVNVKGQDRIIVTTNIPTATAAWHHIAVVKFSNLMKFYYDGYAVGSWTTTENFGMGTNGLVIGNTGDGVGGFNLRMTEIRVSNIARYTMPFNFDIIILYGPLDNDADTTLMLRGSVTNPLLKSIDDYGFPHTAKTITKVGTVGKSDYPTYKFDTGTQHWDFSSLSPSYQQDRAIYFNGGYLTFDMSSGDFNFGTGDFTIEFWLHLPTLNATTYTLIDLRPGNAVGVDASICIQLLNGGLQVIYKGQNILNTPTGYRTGGLIKTAVLNGVTHYYYNFSHIALTKSGNKFTLLVDGNDRNYNTSTQSYSTRIYTDSANSPVANSMTTGSIGAAGPRNSGGLKFYGYMSNIRISNVNRYPLLSSKTDSFYPGILVNTYENLPASVPTGTWRWDSSTVLSPIEIGYYGETIIDGVYVNKNPREFTKVGRMKDNGQGNFTFWGGYISIDNTDKGLDFGTGNFTIQFVVSHTNTNTDQTIYDSRSSSSGLDYGLTIQMKTMSDGKKQIVVLVNGSQILQTNYGNIGQVIAQGGTVPNGYYNVTIPYGITTGNIVRENGGLFTLVRNNGVFTLYSNTNIGPYLWGSYTSPSPGGTVNFSSTKNPVIGTNYDGTNPLYGYINRIRIDRQAFVPEDRSVPFDSNDTMGTFFPGINIPNANTKFFIQTGTQYSAIQEKFADTGFKIQGTRSDVNEKLKYLTLTPANNYNQTIEVTYSVVTPRGSTNSHTATLTN